MGRWADIKREARSETDSRLRRAARRCVDHEAKAWEAVDHMAAMGVPQELIDRLPDRDADPETIDPEAAAAAFAAVLAFLEDKKRRETGQ